MRAARGTEHVVGVVHIRHPVAEGLVDGVLEDAGSLRHGNDLGTELHHPEHVGSLTLDVDLAHVDRAVEAHAGRHRRRRDPVERRKPKALFCVR
jgi:hypothetical protein